MSAPQPPVRDEFEEMRRALRDRRAAAGQIGGATAGGPREPPIGVPPEQQPQAAPQSVVSPAARLIGEVAGSALLPTALGGQVLKRLPGTVPPLVRGAAAIAERAGLAGAGGVLGSEVAPPPGETPEQVAERRKLAGGLSVAGEFVFPALRLARRTPGYLLRRFRGLPEPILPPSPVEPGATEGQQLLRRFGGGITLGQATREAGLVATVENAVAASFTAARPMAVARARGPAAAQAALEEAMPRLANALDAEATGELLDEAVRNSATLQRGFTRAAYRNLDAELVGAGVSPIVDLQPAQQELAGMLAQKLRVRNAHAEEIMNYVTVPGGFVGFQEAEAIRGELLAIGRMDENLIPGIPAVARRAAALVDDQIGNSLNRLAVHQDMAIRTAQATARSTAAMGKELFNNELVGAFVGKRSPEEMARWIFQNDSPSRAKAIMAIIRNPKYHGPDGIPDPEGLISQIQHAFIADKARRTGAGAFGEINWKEFGKSLDNAAGTFRALFTREQASKLRLMARAGELGQRTTAGGTRSGSVFIQMRQAAVTAALGGAALGAAGAVIGFGPSLQVATTGGSAGLLTGIGTYLIAPRFVVPFLTNPTIVSILLSDARRGTIRGATGRLVAQTAARLADAMRQGGIPFIHQRPDGTQQAVEPARSLPLPAGVFGKPQSKLQPGQLRP